MSSGLESIPGVADVTLVRGARAVAGAPPGLLCEVPHGATRAADFASLRAELRGDYPADLQDFFFVNTDVGAPELALQTAALFVAQQPEQSALVVRCLVPRTFIDCNRVIDERSQAGSGGAGAITPGLHAYVRDGDDRRLLLQRHGAYRALATAAFDRVCGGGGRGLMVHSYAPRSIDVPMDEQIVQHLRAAYQPDRIGTWPLRPEVDLIVQDPDGAMLADGALVARVQQGCVLAGLGCTVNGTYPLHPVTLAHQFAVAHRGRTVCLEVRRDLLVAHWDPFAEMAADPARVAKVAAVLAQALAVPG